MGIRLGLSLLKECISSTITPITGSFEMQEGLWATPLTSTLRRLDNTTTNTNAGLDYTLPQGGLACPPLHRDLD